jgi:hypothetical protein
LADQGPNDRDELSAPEAEDSLLDVTIHVLVAFDFGYELDLPKARALLDASMGDPVLRRRQTESIRYRPAPLRVSLESPTLRLGGEWAQLLPRRGHLSFFDFGAASIAVAFPVRATAADLLRIASTLAEPGGLVLEARRTVTSWLGRLGPAITEYELSELHEEYVVFQFPEEQADWLRARPDWIARLVRLDPERIGSDEIREATRLSLSYAPNDLVVLDWPAGLVADRECSDTLQVIEFANVQLLEFRHIDDRLDDRLEAAYRLIRPAQTRRRWIQWGWWRTHDDAVRSVRELEIEATSLFARADNALKLIGDQYLSRVFGLASARFHLDEWQQSIRRKLETVGNVYDLLVEQAGGRRMEVLELIVILLIALEIVLAFVRH